jgi:hypothetical protein
MRKALHPLRGAATYLPYLFCLLVAVESQAKAYIDPGSGAAYYQILLVGAVGLLFRVKRLALWFKSKRASVPPSDERG